MSTGVGCHCLASSQSHGLPFSSAGKETTCNAEDLGLIPGLGRSPGEGKATHSSRASLIAQLVKNLPAIRETWV